MENLVDIREKPLLTELIDTLEWIHSFYSAHSQFNCVVEFNKEH